GGGASLGDGINTAQARDVSGATSNLAQAQVRFRASAFADEGLIVGKVFVDCDCDTNRTQGIEETGIPGVRLYLEDGTSVVTDAEGKYHFDPVGPRTHVLRIDPTTLPAGSRMVALSARNVGDPLGRFVDVQRGEVHHADFAEGSCSDAVRKELHERRMLGEVAMALPTGFHTEPSASPEAVRETAGPVVAAGSDSAAAAGYGAD